MNMYVEKYQIKYDQTLLEALHTKSGAGYLRKYKAKRASKQATLTPPDGISCEQTTNHTGRD